MSWSTAQYCISETYTLAVSTPCEALGFGIPLPLQYHKGVSRLIDFEMGYGLLVISLQYHTIPDDDDDDVTNLCKAAI